MHSLYAIHRFVCIIHFYQYFLCSAVDEGVSVVILIIIHIIYIYLSIRRRASEDGAARLLMFLRQKRTSSYQNTVKLEPIHGIEMDQRHTRMAWPPPESSLFLSPCLSLPPESRQGHNQTSAQS